MLIRGVCAGIVKALAPASCSRESRPPRSGPCTTGSLNLDDEVRSALELFSGSPVGRTCLPWLPIAGAQAEEVALESSTHC